MAMILAFSIYMLCKIFNNVLLKAKRNVWINKISSLLFIFLISIPLTQPYIERSFTIVDKYNNTQSVIASYEYELANWVKNNTPANTRIISDSFTMFVINGLSNRISIAQPAMHVADMQMGEIEKLKMIKIFINMVTAPLSNVSDRTNLISSQAHLSDLHGWNNIDGSNSYATQTNGFWRISRINLVTNNTNTEILMDKYYPIIGGETYTESFLFRHDGTSIRFKINFYTNNGHHVMPTNIVELGGGLYFAYATYTSKPTDTWIRALDILDFTGDWTYIEIKEGWLEKASTPSRLQMFIPLVLKTIVNYKPYEVDKLYANSKGFSEKKLMKDIIIIISSRTLEWIKIPPEDVYALAPVSVLIPTYQAVEISEHSAILKDKSLFEILYRDKLDRFLVVKVNTKNLLARARYMEIELMHALSL